MISVLLGLLDRPIFEILYRSAYRTCIHLEPSISLHPFTKRFIRLSRAEKLKIEPVNPDENLFLVESLVWLVIISSDQDPNAVRSEFLSRLLYGCLCTDLWDSTPLDVGSSVPRSTK
jgi:hypothetical protein